jgi:hypothetical protein
VLLACTGLVATAVFGATLDDLAGVALVRRELYTQVGGSSVVAITTRRLKGDVEPVTITGRVPAAPDDARGRPDAPAALNTSSRSPTASTKPPQPRGFIALVAPSDGRARYPPVVDDDTDEVEGLASSTITCPSMNVWIVQVYG